MSDGRLRTKKTSPTAVIMGFYIFICMVDRVGDFLQSTTAAILVKVLIVCSEIGHVDTLKLIGMVATFRNGSLFAPKIEICGFQMFHSYVAVLLFNPLA